MCVRVWVCVCVGACVCAWTCLDVRLGLALLALCPVPGLALVALNWGRNWPWWPWSGGGLGSHGLGLALVALGWVGGWP